MKLIERGDSWFTTKDTELAAILTALDFEFFDPDDPASVRIQDGKLQVTWLFQNESIDGKRSAREVYKAYKNFKKTIEEKPDDPISYAIASVKNFRVFNDSLKKAKPMHGFKVGKHTIWVTEDDKRYERMINDPRCKKL
tara:strand:+ start:29105 stop:29521 length:417 start_codon:yes stop_codon:yes gene_type:complete